MSEPVRVKNPTTGGEKDTKLARFDLIPPRSLTLLAEVYGKGAEKYADRNWEKGYEWGLSFAAMQRHLWAFWGGEDIDPESGLPHLAHAAWHCMTLMEFCRAHPSLDDRGKSPQRPHYWVFSTNESEAQATLLKYRVGRVPQ